MKFEPSEYSDDNYGWASAFPLSALTVSDTARRKGLSNQPDTDAHNWNIGLLSDFLAKIPFPFRVNSGYRSYAVNTAVGGARSSQHMNGLAADISPLTMSNKDLAAWFYKYRADFPELDQVIWYNDTSHVHIGICPQGGTGCKRRGEFLRAQKEGSHYYPWAPSASELAKQAALFAANRPLHTGLAAVGLYVAASAAVSIVVLAALWRYKRG
jgi:hypothetical protein